MQKASPSQWRRAYSASYSWNLETVLGDNFAKQLQSIPLSNDTVVRRIGDIAEDVEHQLFGKLRDKSFFNSANGSRASATRFFLGAERGVLQD